jgi:hypothetical protein
MRNAAGEIPQVACRHVSDEVLAVVFDSRDPRVPCEHDRPFGLLVPVQLPDAAGFEPHVDASHFGRDRQFALRYFPRPAAVLEVVVRVGKGEP